MHDEATTSYIELIEQLKNPELPVVIEETNQVNGEIFAFMGMGKEGNGTSKTVFNIAKELSRAVTSKKVLLIDLNISEPEIEDMLLEYKRRSNLNLDQVYNLANAGKISGRDIYKHTLLMKDSKNFFVITGTRLPFLADNFNVDIVRAVLQAATQEYEYVFLDCPAHFDNAATVAALIESHIVTVVSDYSGSGLRVFQYFKKAVLDMHPNILAKIRLLGIDKNQKEQLPTSILQEVLGISFEFYILRSDDPEYIKSINDYLAALELEHNEVVNKKQKRKLLDRVKLKLLSFGKVG